MIAKTLSASIERIQSTNEAQKFTLDIDHYLLKGYELDMQKEARDFSVKIEFKPFPGFSTSQLHRIDCSSNIRIYNSQVSYILAAHSLNLYQTNADFFDARPIVTLKGSITQLATGGDESFDGKFLRLVIPVGKPGALSSSFRAIRGYHYNTDLKVARGELIKVMINQAEYHLFTFQYNDQSYLAVDTTETTQLSDFRKLSHSILLGLGFLFGDLHLNEGYVFSSLDADFSVVENLWYSSYRDSLLKGYGIYTTNAYSVVDMTSRTEQESEQRVDVAQQWSEKLEEITEGVFGKLCELFYESEPFNRAAIIVLEANLLPLEIKGSAYSAALEAIASVIIEEFDADIPKPMAKPDFKNMKDKFFKILDSALPNIPANEGPRTVLVDRIHRLNNSTNFERLSLCFSLLGYRQLAPYERDALKARDKFQHGELPVADITDENVFRQVYHICMVLHRMIYTIVLLKIGFKGYIKNYPQLHAHITGIELNEGIFFEICKESSQQGSAN